MDTLIYRILAFPRNSQNGKQIRGILKTLTRKQQYKMQTFVKNILNGKILLTDKQYRKLAKHKKLIRTLSKTKLNVSYIIKNYKVFSELINVMLTKNESHAENDTSSIRRMGTVSKKRENRRSSSKRKCIKNKKGRVGKEKGKKRDYTSEENSYESGIEEKSSGEEEEYISEGEVESSTEKSSESSEGGGTESSEGGEEEGGDRK